MNTNCLNLIVSHINQNMNNKCIYQTITYNTESNNSTHLITKSWGCINQTMVYNTEPNICIDVQTKLCGCVNQTTVSKTEPNGCINVNTNPVFKK